MNADTGQVKTKEEMKAMLESLMNGELEEEKIKWFKIDHAPSDNCTACSGAGYIGRFANGKVIPCMCVFEYSSAWANCVSFVRSMKKNDKRSLEEVIDRKREE